MRVDVPPAERFAALIKNGFLTLSGTTVLRPAFASDHLHRSLGLRRSNELVSLQQIKASDSRRKVF